MNRKTKTFMAQPKDVKRQWLLLDASGKTLGRLASEIAKILRGKHKVTYTPHVDTGDGVIIINAEKVRVSGSKAAQKMYYRYTGYAGGLRQTTYRDMMERKPTYVLRHAIEGMIDRKTSMGRAQLRRLRIYAGTEHDMPAQKPIKVNI